MTTAQAAIATGLIVAAPGPAVAVSLSSAVDGGRRGGMFAIAGLAAGIVLHAFVAAAGLAVILASRPAARDALQVAGALFLVTVGLRMIVRGIRESASAARPTEAAGRTAYVVRGLLTNVLNPWILGFYLSLVPALAEGDGHSAFVGAGAVAGIHVAQLAVWHGLLVVAVSSAARLYERRGGAVRVVAGAALVIVAARFLLR